MRAKKMPTTGKCSRQNSTESGRAFRVRFRPQIYGKFRTYTNKNAYIFGGKL
jgi:hypothetical protein